MAALDKPRRLEPESVAYLLSLGPAVEAAGSDPEGEAADLLVENLLAELRSRLASAACDRAAHPVLEAVVALASLPQSLAVLRGLAGYGPFLAGHRHSSHLLQTLLARIGQLMRDSSDDQLGETVAAFARPLLERLSSLAVDISGSHVGELFSPAVLSDPRSADAGLSARGVSSIPPPAR